MKNWSAKNKIYLLVALWLGVCALMIFYFFSILDGSNGKVIDVLNQQRAILTSLQAERDSYQQAQADLDKISKQSLQPDSFFSKDTSFVNELITLENLAQNLNVKLTVTGVSGTVQNAAIAPTITPIAEIPYIISLTGPLPNVVKFLDSILHLNFVTTINSLSLSAISNTEVVANVSAKFYLQK